MRAVAATPEVLSPWRRRGLALLISPSPRAGDLAAMEGWSARERWSARAIAPLVWVLELGAAAFGQGQLQYLVRVRVRVRVQGYG